MEEDLKDSKKLHTTKHQHDISKTSSFILSTYISSSKECSVFILMKVKMTGKNQFVNSLTRMYSLDVLSTNKTEEAYSYHYENKNAASEMLIFSNSLFTGSWRDGW